MGIKKFWTKRIESSGFAPLTSIATAGDGSVYVAGEIENGYNTWKTDPLRRGKTDAFISKINKDGSIAWTKLLGSSSYDWSNGIAVSKDGSIYSTGVTFGSIGGQSSYGSEDAFIAKYDKNGAIQWVRSLGTSSEDQASSIATSLDGSVYITGFTGGNLDGQSNQGGSDAFIAKYNGNGTKAWTRLFGTSNNDIATSLATSFDGSCFIGGITYDVTNGNMSVAGSDKGFVAKFNVDGTEQWSKSFAISDNSGHVSVAVANDGSVYIAGVTNGKTGQSWDGDCFITKYNSDGVMIWTDVFGTPYTDASGELTVGIDGSVYISGTTFGNLDGQNPDVKQKAFIVKYSSNGSREWTNLAVQDVNTGSVPVAIATDNTIYMASTEFTYRTAYGNQLGLEFNGIVTSYLGTPSSIEIGNTTTSASKSTILAPTISRLMLTGNSNITGTGNALNNYIMGNNGDNKLDGSAGYDFLVGGKGNDTYIVDSPFDRISENADEGTDTVESSVSWTLGSNLENLTLIGISNITGTGNSLNNVITGNSGDNTLDGGAGNDQMTGGQGNDTYYVDSIGDTILDSSGVDTVFSSISWILETSLENIQLTGSDPITGIGNSGNNTIFGNDGNNLIDGKGGADILMGGLGADCFQFSVRPTFGAQYAVRIIDYKASEKDIIRISKSALGLSSSATASIATVSNTSALDTALRSTSNFVYNLSNGNLYFNQNGTGSGFGSGGIFAILSTANLMVPPVAPTINLI